MAMRPDVRRHALVVIVFSLAQWFSCAISLRMNYLTATTNQRILYFCVSSLVGALLIFVALIYMVLKEMRIKLISASDLTFRKS